MDTERTKSQFSKWRMETHKAHTDTGRTSERPCLCACCLATTRTHPVYDFYVFLFFILYLNRQLCSLPFLYILSHSNPWLLPFLCISCKIWTLKMVWCKRTHFILLKNNFLVTQGCDGSREKHSSSFQTRLPGAVFLLSFVFVIACSPQTHGLPIRALRHSHSSLRLICPLAARFSSTDLSFTPWRLQRQSRETTRSQPQKSRDDYVEIQGKVRLGPQLYMDRKIKVFWNIQHVVQINVKQVQ